MPLNHQWSYYFCLCYLQTRSQCSLKPGSGHSCRLREFQKFQILACKMGKGPSNGQREWDKTSCVVVFFFPFSLPPVLKRSSAICGGTGSNSNSDDLGTHNEELEASLQIRGDEAPRKWGEHLMLFPSVFSCCI